MNIEEKLKNIPVSPGVYLMKDKDGDVIYIGKAKSLRSRVRSYFRETGDTRYAVKFLAARVENIDYIVTVNEKEALLLEDTLVKQHKPKYNIRLKDSKTYVSIRVTINEKFPRITVTRQIKKDGARYFGPYTSARDVRDTIKFLRRIFPLCTCSPSVFKNRVRPCLDYQLGLCAAPAVGLISEEAYRELVDAAILFLEGKNRELVKKLKEKMNEAAKRLDFETAAKLRDRMAAIEEMLEEQKVVSHKDVDRDVFALVHSDAGVTIQALLIRDGRLVGSTDYFFEDSGLPDEEILSSFLTQYYQGARFIPDEVLIPLWLEDSPVIEEWISDKKGKKVPISIPERGDRLKLIRMAEENAKEAIKKRMEAETSKKDILAELQRRIHLSRTPERIEAFDISNIGGKLAVGAMVTFTGGQPDKGSYRLFKIKEIEGPDDYLMMYQVLSRRYKKPEGAEKPLPMPDMILVDGGKGQLGMAVQVIHELGIQDVEVRALAKERDEMFTGKIIKAQPKGERVYIPNVKDPVFLKEGSKPDLLLRRIRDEVHRFAITYHRKLRAKDAVGSPLDDIAGIGKMKKKALYDKFGDIETMAKAEVAELMIVPGITEKIATDIKEALKGFIKGNNINGNSDQ